jgi:hypothetical protein
MPEPRPLPARGLPVGVYRLRNGKYTATFARWTQKGRMQKHLGTFTTVEDALAARKRAEAEYKEATT